MPLILICENTWVFWSFDANNAANRLLRTAAKQNSDGCLQTAQNAISLAIDSVLIERHPQKQCASTPVIVDLSQGIIFLIKQADVCVKFYFCTTPLSLSFSLALARSQVGGRCGSSPSRGGATSQCSFHLWVVIENGFGSLSLKSVAVSCAKKRCRGGGGGAVRGTCPSGVFSVTSPGADHTPPICRARHKQCLP